MTSRLFQAVVGVGIALGTASTACDHAADAKIASNDALTAASSTADAGAGEPFEIDSADAAAATPIDAPIDAFCDAAWPTTKGNMEHPACIDPRDECAAAGPPVHCVALLAAHQCDFDAQGFFSQCASGQWQCPNGTAPTGDCWCWGEARAGESCTDAGFVLADAAGGG